MRVVAMLSVGAMGIAGDIFNQERCTRPMVDVLKEAFDSVV